jgi:hypothetical protein
MNLLNRARRKLTTDFAGKIELPGRMWSDSEALIVTRMELCLP